MYADHGLTDTNRQRPGLGQALAAVRAGDLFVVTKLDRLARSVSDARNIVDELTVAGVRLSIGGNVHDPTDPVGRLLLNVLSMVAESEGDLIRARTRESMAIAKAKGASAAAPRSFRGPRRCTWFELHLAGRRTSAEIAAMFKVSRATVYRAIARAGPLPVDPLPEQPPTAPVEPLPEKVP